MTKGRLEAFSDGVIAILITVLVLELKVPRGAGACAAPHSWKRDSIRGSGISQINATST